METMRTNVTTFLMGEWGEGKENEDNLSRKGDISTSLDVSQ
jgi:hypothetical protein